MRVHLLERPPTLPLGLLQLLLTAYDIEPGDVYVVSPWARDVTLPAGDAGPFATVFGGHRETVLLSEVLERLATRHRVHLITKPPHELLDPALLGRLDERLRVRHEILEEEDLKGRLVRDAIASELNDSIKDLARRLSVHLPTVDFGLDMAARGVRLSYLNRLHAKVVACDAGALVGSANLTVSGLERNEELTLGLMAPDARQPILDAAATLAGRAVPAAEYGFAPFLRKAGVTSARLRELAAHTDLAPESARAVAGRLLDVLEA